MYWVYILSCSDDTLYTGSTPRLQRRIQEHNEGKGAKYTRGRGPVLLLQAWQVDDRSQALQLEAFIKGFERSRKLEMVANPKLLPLLAKENGYGFSIEYKSTES